MEAVSGCHLERLMRLSASGAGVGIDSVGTVGTVVDMSSAAVAEIESEIGSDKQCFEIAAADPTGLDTGTAVQETKIEK